MPPTWPPSMRPSRPIDTLSDGFRRVQQPAGNRRRSRRRGFTRTDTLVVIAGVCLVAFLALSYLTAQARRASLAQCTDHLGQVNGAVLKFAADHEERLPGPDPAIPGNLWWWYKEQVKGTLGLTGPSGPDDAVFACPDDRGYTDPHPFHASARFDFGSYVFNGVTMPGVPHIAGLATSSIQHPNRTLLVMEWTAHAPLSWHASRTGRRNAPFYSDATSVVGFVDGHVRFLPIYYDGYNAAFTQDPPSRYEYQYSGR